MSGTKPALTIPVTQMELGKYTEPKNDYQETRREKGQHQSLKMLRREMNEMHQGIKDQVGSKQG